MEALIGHLPRTHTQLYSEVKINYWSLGANIINIPSGSDMNSYVTPGNYACRTNDIISSLSNCQMVRAFSLKVSYPLGDVYYIQQEFVDTAGIKITRVYNKWSNTWSTIINATKDDLSSFLDVVTAEYTVTLSANQSTITSGSVTIKNGYTPLPKMLSVRTTGSDAVFASGDNYYENGKIYVYLKNTANAERTIKVTASMLCYKS